MSNAIGFEEKMGRTMWRSESVQLQDRRVLNDQTLCILHLDTKALNSVWHTTSRYGSWSIMEALAAICYGLFATTRGKSDSVTFIVPSLAQGLLMESLLDDLSITNATVSTAPSRPHQDSHPNLFVVSAPRGKDAATSSYMELVQEILKQDIRSGLDEVISVGEQPLLDIHETTQSESSYGQTLRRLSIGHFSNRGDLMRRLLSLSSTGQEHVLLPMYLAHDINSIPVLMRRHVDWSEEKVICLCGLNVPPIMTHFINALSEKADVLTNRPELFEDRATPLRSVDNMRDFADEALLCTWAGWLLVEPQLGYEEKPHRDATLFMHAASTTRFITKFALGKFGEIVAEEVPTPDNVPLRATGYHQLDQTNVAVKEVVSTLPSSSLAASHQDSHEKRHRCCSYTDVFDKKLQKAIERLTDEETGQLLASLEASEAK